MSQMRVGDDGWETLIDGEWVLVEPEHACEVCGNPAVVMTHSGHWFCLEHHEHH